MVSQIGCISEVFNLTSTHLPHSVGLVHLPIDLIEPKMLPYAAFKEAGAGHIGLSLAAILLPLNFECKQLAHAFGAHACWQRTGRHKGEYCNIAARKLI